jgi:hypothetical protein
LLLDKLSTNKGICNVAGISGHTMLAIEIASLLGESWKHIFIACLIEMVPIHHSITEIYNALIDMDLITNEPRNVIEYINQIIIEISEINRNNAKANNANQSSNSSNSSKF